MRSSRYLFIVVGMLAGQPAILRAALPRQPRHAQPESIARSESRSVPDIRTAIAWQIALEREGFSPGIIDGKIGRKTAAAVRMFQQSRGLPQTGALDAPTASALRVLPNEAVTLHKIDARDTDRIAPLPKTWPGKAAATWLGYESVAEAVAERFHCSMRLLATLNPTKDLARLGPGDALNVPNVAFDAATSPCVELRVDLLAKTIQGIGPDGRSIALFHCSVAAKESNLPNRDGRVESVSHDPTYLFDPRMWPEVKGVDRKLLIPPGPRNPVGRCWIGLSLAGYGIHGTPNPELIGRTGSHGCIRLTNWDAVRLSSMVKVGTPVKFIKGSAERVTSGQH